ncbi:MAG: SDR family NAD(P)-dependent oxidoreductase, partial [Candidatus Limnocylindria bacterium]|nr:SDR family NAD(P)-dependent oxidoreductase [Candidatus Limnocylindria bacterium]
MSLAGRVAVVAGAGRGIGRAIALGLAGEGAEVVALARTLAEVEAVAAEIRAAGGAATARRVDVTDEAEVTALAGWLASRASPPRIL